MRTQALAVAIVLAVVSFLGACHQSQSEPSVAVAQGSLAVPAHGFLPLSLTTPGSGVLTVQLNLDPDIVVAGIFSSDCTVGTSVRSACRVLNYTEASTTSSPKTLTAPDAPAGAYVVIFGNVGPTGETLTYSVALAAS